MTDTKRFYINIIKAYTCNKQNMQQLWESIPTNFISLLLSIKKWFTSKPRSALPLAFILSSRVNSFFQSRKGWDFEDWLLYSDQRTWNQMWLPQFFHYRNNVHKCKQGWLPNRGASHFHIINENSFYFYLFRSTKAFD